MEYRKYARNGLKFEAHDPLYRISFYKASIDLYSVVFSPRPRFQANIQVELAQPVRKNKWLG